MAKSNGILNVEGTLENLTFYKKQGKMFVRRKGGVSKQRITNDPNFVRTRENNHEFSACADASKAIRNALGSLAFKTKGSQLVSRMLKLMYQIKRFDTVSPRGSRNVATGLETDGGKSTLVGFDFNPYAPLDTVLHAPFQLDTADGLFTITSLVPEEQIKAPAGANIARFQFGALGINLATNESELALSSEQDVTLDMSTATVNLPLTALPATTGVTMFLVSISFYQVVNGVLYPLKNEGYNVLHILEVA